ISVDIFNNIENAHVALNLLELAMKIEIDDLTRDKFEQDFEVINEYLEIERNDVILKRYASVFNEIKGLIEKINEYEISPVTAVEKICKMVKPDELNALPKIFDEIRNQTALALRHLSVVSWNIHSDFKSAIRLLDLATSIEIDAEIYKQLENDRKELCKNAPDDFHNERKKTPKITEPLDLDGLSEAVLPNPKKEVMTSQDKSDQEYPIRILLTLFFALLLATILVINHRKTDIISVFDRKLKIFTDNKATAREEKKYRSNKTESIFKGNQLENGASPYYSYFGRGVFNREHHNWVEFLNSNEYDAVICLVEYYSDITIRHKYIQSGTTLRMDNIPNGNYYIKGYFGKDWNPYKRLLDGRIRGGFDTNPHFSKSLSYNDAFELVDDGYKYTTLQITIKPIIGGNLYQVPINESDFF
ncbi:hypothetical protein JXJ21_09070, partial [candidate division KSB1 bacterium]|nr:hypothetical protein [candidate division KSB1 bacterium]